jgi:hypothetical protein
MDVYFETRKKNNAPATSELLKISEDPRGDFVKVPYGVIDLVV